MKATPALGLWLIATGSVKIFKINLDGGEHILHLLGAGNTFNDIAALDGGANPAHAAALSETSVWLISRREPRRCPRCRSGAGAARNPAAGPARARTCPPD